MKTCCCVFGTESFRLVSVKTSKVFIQRGSGMTMVVGVVYLIQIVHNTAIMIPYDQTYNKHDKTDRASKTAEMVCQNY